MKNGRKQNVMDLDGEMEIENGLELVATCPETDEAITYIKAHHSCREYLERTAKRMRFDGYYVAINSIGND